MKIELEYVQVGDYFLPNLTLPPQPDRDLGKYGLLRRSYLQEHCPGYYNRLILTGKLYAHLLETEDAAQAILDNMVPGMAKAAGATEELKACNPMRWVGLMNNCIARAEEIIYTELVYS